MNTDDYKRRLLQVERELVERLGNEVEIAHDTGDDDQSDAGDRATVDVLKDEYFGRANRDTVVLAQVRDALRRIDDGTYGKCVVDGGPIEPKRLEAEPWTPYCLRHQTELEQRAQLRTPSM